MAQCGPASLPGYPRLNACVRPSWLTGLSDQKQKQDGGLPAGLGVGVLPVAAAERSEAAIEAEGLARRTPRFPRSCEVSGLAALRADRSLATLGSGYTKHVRRKSCSVAMACGGVPPEQCLCSASAVNGVLRSKAGRRPAGL